MAKGFIVHPNETFDGKYHASYGNHNKTARSFDTLREAKEYLRKKNIKKALYDSPSGAKDININQIKAKINKNRKKQQSTMDWIMKI